MTTPQIHSQGGSWTTGVPSSPKSGRATHVVFAEFNVARPLPLSRTRTLESVIGKHEADPARSALLAEARRIAAATLYEGEPGSLAALRLRAGMSQAQLAAQAETSQSHIARIERGQNDPSTDLIVRISQALGVTPNEVFEGVRAHRQATQHD